MRHVSAYICFLVLGVAATCRATVQVSGASSRFVVDTRPDILVEDVRSDYCSGAYGGAGGARAVFISGVRCEVEFTIKASGRDGNPVDHYLVNGNRQDGNVFTVNVGDCVPGERLKVIAVDEQGRESEPFRVNMDIAEPPPMWNSVWVRTVVADKDPDEHRVIYHGPDCRTFCLFDALSDAAEVGFDNPVELDLTPSLKLWQSVNSKTGQYCEGTDLGLGGGNYHELTDKVGNSLGRFGGLSLSANLTGGMVYYYDPSREMWLVFSAKLGVKYDGSWKIRQRIPQFPLVYLEIGFVSNGSFVLQEENGEWYGDLSMDPMIALKATAGAGVDVVAAAEASGQGGILLEARVPEKLKKIAVQGKVMWRVVILGFEKEGTWLEAEYQLYPRAPVQASMRRLLGAGQRTAAQSDMNGGFTPVSRDYGNGTVPVVRRGLRLMSASANSAADGMQVLMQDGYPTPQPSLAVAGTKAVLAYVRDNDSRSNLNRTELVYREESSDGAWGGETHVWDDGTADFQPKLALLPDGKAVAAWMNAKRTFADTAGFEDFCTAQEIAVGVRNPQSETWTCANLTDDTAFDGVPVLKGATNGTAAVAWVRNASGAYIGSSAQPSDLAVAFYRNGTWSTASVAVTGVGAVLSHDLAWDGSRAILIWAQDADGDLTTDDAEIWAKTFANGNWSAAVRLSGAAIGAQRPYAWFLPDGSAHTIWAQGGVLYAADRLDGTTATNVAVAATATVPGDFRVALREDASATILWTVDPTASGKGLEGEVMSADYTPGVGLSAPATLLRREAVLRNLSGAVDDAATFRMAFESVAVSTNAAGERIRGAVDLAVCRREAVRDVGVTAENCSFANEVVVGETNALVVGIQNYGSVEVGSAGYRVWAGEGDEKTLLTSGQVNLGPLSREVVKVPWTPEAGLSETVFTIEVDYERTTGDSNLENNTLVWRPDVGSPVLSLRNAKAVKATDSLRLISARIHNDGVASLPAGTVVKFWRGEVGGELIGTDTAGVVSGGTAGEYDVGVAWNITGVTFTSAWERVVIELPAECEAQNAVVWTTTPLYDSGSGDTPSVTSEISSVVDISELTGVPSYMLTLSPSGKMFVLAESWFTGAGIDISGGVTAALLNANGANGIPRYQSFLFGLDPESSVPADKQLKATLTFDADGTPVVSCTPRKESQQVSYTVLGKAKLGDAKWKEVTDANRADMRFFKVKVEVKND